MGPGINPDTGFVWSQSDMDKCGGKEVDGKYAYYTTVDFPYYFQCYAGETSLGITFLISFPEVLKWPEFRLQNVSNINRLFKSF